MDRENSARIESKRNPSISTALFAMLTTDSTEIEILPHILRKGASLPAKQPPLHQQQKIDKKHKNEIERA